MIRRLMMHTAHDCQVLYLLPHPRQMLGNRNAGNPGRDRVEFTADFTPRRRLHVERIEVAHTTPAEHHDHAAGTSETTTARGRGCQRQRRQLRRRQTRHTELQKITPLYVGTTFHYSHPEMRYLATDQV